MIVSIPDLCTLTYFVVHMQQSGFFALQPVYQYCCELLLVDSVRFFIESK